MSATPAKGYVFSDPSERDGHHGELVSYLAAILDPFTTRRLAPFVDAPSRCLEIGAGAGTVAYWMAEQGAQVTATDTDPRNIPRHPRIRLLRHDIASDPLQDGYYDVIHARLVLAHLPTRAEVIDKLVAALAPGGVVMVDEFASGGWERCVLDAPDRPAAQRLFDAYHRALVAVMERAGTDPAWGRDAPRVMRAAGLVDVQAELGGAVSWQGGEPGCMLPYEMTTQIRPQLLECGMSETDIDALRELLLDHRLWIVNGIAVSTIGRRP